MFPRVIVGSLVLVIVDRSLTHTIEIALSQLTRLRYRIYLLYLLRKSDVHLITCASANCTTEETVLIKRERERQREVREHRHKTGRDSAITRRRRDRLIFPRPFFPPRGWDVRTMRKLTKRSVYLQFFIFSFSP